MWKFHFLDIYRTPVVNQILTSSLGISHFMPFNTDFHGLHWRSNRHLLSGLQRIITCTHVNQIVDQETLFEEERIGSMNKTWEKNHWNIPITQRQWIAIRLIARETISETNNVKPVIPLNCVLNVIRVIGFLIDGHYPITHVRQGNKLSALRVFHCLWCI